VSARRQSLITAREHWRATTDHRSESDLDLLRSLSIGSYRFQLPRPACCPKAGRVNLRDLNFYDRLVDGLLDLGDRVPRRLTINEAKIIAQQG
jgi:beta-glucosidase/6-phospho-beta-glucosidase/beta-galactosidase